MYESGKGHELADGGAAGTNAIGWDAVLRAPYPAANLDVGPDALPGRVLAQVGPVFEVITPEGPVQMQIAGRLRHEIRRRDSVYPAVGDYLVMDRAASRIVAVLPRVTDFVRKEAGFRVESQTICANVDWAVVVTTPPAAGAHEEAAPGEITSLADFSIRRIERYIATLDPGIRPLVVLNKCDLVADPELVRRHTASQLPGVPVVPVSALTGLGLDELAAHFSAGQSIVLVGSSGCGKSTMISALVGTDIRTAAVRSVDGRGRHTTTVRRTYLLPSGLFLIDTPGMREIQVWAHDQKRPESAGAFPDIVELEGECRFADCRHQSEPGCAVRAAVRAGRIDPDRYQSYLRLRDETEGLRDLREVRVRLTERRSARRQRMRRRSSSE